MLRKRKPHKIRKKRSIFSYRFFWLGLLVIIISGGLFYLIVFSAWFQITEIKIRGNEKVSDKEIQKLIQPQIGQQVGFWETRSIFLADLKEINKTLLRESPLIGEVEIRRDFPNTLVVTVEERQPVAIFYQDEQEFLIDKQGVIFYSINEPHQYLEIESLILTEELKLGKRILEKELVSKILEIEQRVEEINIPIIKMLIVSDEKLTVKTLENWEIYFNLKNNISNQVFNLSLVLDEKIPQEKRKNLEYIDLRFGNRVFFRYQD